MTDLWPHSVVFGDLLTTPLLPCLILPTFVLCQSLPHYPSSLSFLVPQFYKAIWSCCQDKLLSWFLDNWDIVDPVIVSFNLQNLFDVGRRNYVVGLYMWKIMSIRAILCSTKVVIVLYSIRVFIANHFHADRL